VDVLHHNLEAVEAASLGDLDLAGEALDKVLVDDAIGGGEECEDVGDEEALVVVEAPVPVMKVLREIDLLGGPERSLGLLVHLPDLCEWMLVLPDVRRVIKRVERVVTYIVVLDGEENEAVGVLLQDRLAGLLGLNGGCDRVNLLLDLIGGIILELRNADDGLVCVLFVCRREVDLLYW
jgi:hypothetical protein